MDLYNQARRFAQAGIVALPAGAGKRPAVKSWKQYQDRHPTHEEHAGWFKGDSGAKGIGLVCGDVSGGLIMVEFEGRAVEADFPTRVAELADASGLGDLWGRLLNGYVVASPSGGIHLYFRVIGHIPGNTKLARRKVDGEVQVLIETRGEGGWVVTAPTTGNVHPTGKPWMLLRGGPDTIPTLTEDEHQAVMTLARALDELPEPAADPAIFRALDELPEPVVGADLLVSPHLSDDELRPGDDYNARADWADILDGWTRLFSHGNTVYWRRPGKATGISATTGHADEADRLYVFTTSTELPSETPITKFAAYAFLNHGGDMALAAKALRAEGYGGALPAPERPVLRLLTSNTPPASAEAQARALHPSIMPLPLPDAEPVVSLSDDGNARLLAHRHEENLRYVSGIGWHVWGNGAWNPDRLARSMELMKDTIHSIEITNKEVARHQVKSLSARALAGALHLAESMDPLRVDADQLDAQPHLANHRGKTTDLATGITYEADPAELHTMRTGCNPQRMPTPMFDAYLRDTFDNDAELIAYLQRLCGYALTGLQSHHVLPFLHGQGKNGKSVLLDLLLLVFGDYAIVAPAKFLMAGGSGHETEIARLRGRRLIVCNEVGVNDKFDEVKIKALTGGDRLAGRFMRQDFFTFAPTHHIMLAGNHQPRISAGGESFWRRLRLIPFEHTVPEDKRIPQLANVLFHREGPGILQWLIDGATEVIRSGRLSEPPRVLAATAEYAEEEDAFGRWFADCCRLGGGEAVRTKVKIVYASYVRWCAETHETPLSMQGFGRSLKQRFGVVSVVGNDARFYQNVSLTIDADDPRGGGGGYAF